MEGGSGDHEPLFSNHLVADGTKDVLLQNVDRTISQDLTEKVEKAIVMNTKTRVDRLENHSYSSSKGATGFTRSALDERRRSHGDREPSDCK